MPTQLTRRQILCLAACALVVASMAPHYARAQQPAGVDAFIKGFAQDLIAIVNGPEPAAQKKSALGPVIDRNVDVEGVARFCLGRFWASATPAQQSEYVTLFHHVLLNNISGHLGDYRGVSYTLTGDTQQGGRTLVGSTITRPNQPPIDVQWVVDSASGAPKVVDVIAEGTSMRITTRSDYASYLSQHGNSIDALIAALHRQLDNNA
jgi:phospholipid transport system substrate-binding protein